MGIIRNKMAAVRRLLSVDITGTCLKVRGSVGEIYVSEYEDNVPDLLRYTCAKNAYTLVCSVHP